jgi:pSer/pThr/pTyr-binding forkhead associated (FHA) protein
MPELIVKFGDKVIERVVTEKRRISIGRTKDNDIVLENRGVSRKHAQIEFNNNAAVIIDNESLNGVFVNNRKVSEELLRDEDIITIGKYSLVYKSEVEPGANSSDLDGTMVLNTKQQKQMLENDKLEREIVHRVGGNVLLGLENTEFSEFKLEREVTTIGKAKFVHVRAKGFTLSGIQAKIVSEKEGHYIVNLGKSGKTKVNGTAVDRHLLRNGDIVQIGKTSFRFVEAG